MSDSGYTFLDQLLHRLALNYAYLAKISFELDQDLVKRDSEQIVKQKHVFISGLARAGTTVLMRQFYATGIYKSLTYRDMPFVLAPNLWRKLSSISQRNIDSAERAHGDNLLVDVDSPESFDEVFWRIFCGDEYINKTHLLLHEPSDDIINKYIYYVNAILSSQTPYKERYLSKNNNNILRLNAINNAFPNALVLIPFREPLQHATSLYRQHKRFLELQKTSKFTLSYMTWLGHHEFGLDHRPFLFSDLKSLSYPNDTLEYWLQLWCEVYSWLENSIPASAVFICYEDLCSYEKIWSRLMTLAEIKGNHKESEMLELKKSPVNKNADVHLANHAIEIYERLVKLSRKQLS